ncbi:MAG: hypothetical protein QG559_1058 [Campylobacterota bacterium]|nr:hypothetical protein [Campylobacterota bacterium]
MRYIFLALIMAVAAFAEIIKTPIVSIDKEKDEAVIQIGAIDVGMSGFVVHKIDAKHTVILKSAQIKEFDAKNKTAKIALSEFTTLDTESLPSGKWSVGVGDDVIFAFGYTRALLVAPNEEIYHRVTKGSKVQWVHPDIFATLLSYNGHPTPLRSDFTALSDSNSIGIVFVYLNEKVFTLDAKSFKILAISEAKLEQKEVQLPFYTRVPEIRAAWWGEGSDELEEYEPHYYELLVKANAQDKRLYEIIKSGGEKLEDLLEEFDFEGKRDDRKKTFGLF